MAPQHALFLRHLTSMTLLVHTLLLLQSGWARPAIRFTGVLRSPGPKVALASEECFGAVLYN